jgi:Tfp pilus assembly protein PilF
MRRQMPRRTAAALCVLPLLHTVTVRSAGSPVWYEIRSPHFVVWSENDDGGTRRLVWQLEQVRSALAASVPAVRLELTKPMLVLAARDERGMRALAPHFWEVKGGVRPVSVWVGGADRYYIAIRSDVRAEDHAMVNPHASTYFSYANLVMDSSFGHQLPLWLSRGLAELLSNTIVTDGELRLGVPIPSNLELLREGGRWPLRQLTTMVRSSPELTGEYGLQRFDAQSWALVHYLMFGEKGAHRARLNQLVALARAGRPAAAAFEEVMGNADSYEQPLNLYIANPILHYGRLAVDASVARERFEAKPLPASVAAAGRAAFHVAMGRPAEARALIAEARQADADEPDAFTAEALLHDRDGNADAAAAAYEKAVALGSTHAYPYYRSARLLWQDGVTEEEWRRMDALLSRAIELHETFSWAHAMLAEARASLNEPAARIIPHLRRAMELEPTEAWHRISAARALVKLRGFSQARQAAESALSLADSDEVRAEAQRVLDSVSQAERRPAEVPASEP